MTPEEHKLIMKFLETKDQSIIDHVIDNPHAYSAEMVNVAIGIDFVTRFSSPRIVCWNSILLPEK